MLDSGRLLKVIIVILAAISSLHASLENELNTLFLDLLRQDQVTSRSTIAVLPFTQESADSSRAGRYVAEYAVTFFSSQPKYRIVERMEFAKVMHELALSQSGALADSLALEAGKMLQAEAVLTGAIVDAMGKRIISARIINTETGTVRAASSITVTGDISKAQLLLSERSSPTGALFRSAIIPGWGQFYVKAPVEGSLCLGLFAVSTGALVWSALDLGNKKEKFSRMNDGTDPSVLHLTLVEKIRLTADAKTARDDAVFRTNVLIGVEAGVWLVNLLDALIAGTRDSRSVHNLYFSARVNPIPGAQSVSVSLTALR